MSASLTTVTSARPGRHYRDFLTPALHTRFVHASLLPLGLCYAEAIWLGEWHLFWQWFPIGPAGVRTLLLFISCLAILVLRVAQIHAGPRTTTYPLETLYQQVTSIKAYQTIAWYGFSALMYCEVYMWSAPKHANLHFVESIRSIEHMRLNERPIFFRTLFACLGIAQACMHLYHDYDNINIPVMKFRRSTQKTEINALPHPRTQIKASILIYFHRAFLRTCFTTLGSLFVYVLFLRQLLWRSSYMLVGAVYSLGKQNKATRFASLTDLVGRFFVAGFLLVMLWEISNAAFTAYTRQEPVKRGFPLTNESKNPNGSLIAGLNTAKPLVKTFAYWETVLIMLRYENRCQMLYTDKPRPEDVSGAHIWQSCMDQIGKLMIRLEAYDKPVPGILEKIQNPSALLPSPSPNPEIRTLPRIAARPAIGNAAVTVAPPPPKPTVANAFGASIDQIAKTHGQGNNANGNTASLITILLKNFLQRSISALSSLNANTTSINMISLKQTLNTYTNIFLHTRYAWLIHQTFSRRATAVVAGVPHSDLSTLTDAITIIVELVARSPTEDRYGFVAPRVSSVVKTFGGAIIRLKAFKMTLQPHWTDVGFREGAGDPEKEEGDGGGVDSGDGSNRERSRKSSRDVEAVDQLITTFKQGLERVIITVAEFADSIGLSQEDLKQAKGLVGKD